MIDASFEKIENIRKHENADMLEIAIISGWQVVVRKGEFKVGDVVFYIREDSRLLGDIAKWPWQAPLLSYLGSGGRVKTIRLRGEWSSGIAVSLDKVFGHISVEKSKDWKADNERLNTEFPGAFLMGKYGICHWEAPIKNVGDIQAKGGLPYSIPKSDEANVQELRKNNTIPFGQKCLVTKKLDGTSTTIIAFPDGRTHVCSRSNDLVKTCDNVWNRAAKNILPLAEAWAKHYNKPIALRGEVCGPSIQKFSFNRDKDIAEPTFFCYGTIILDEKDYDVRNGQYGTPWHFLNVAAQIKELTGNELKTVPIIGETEMSEDLIQEYLNKPLEFGEGVVINAVPMLGKCSHFKIKSLAYLEAISKK